MLKLHKKYCRSEFLQKWALSKLLMKEFKAVVTLAPAWQG